MKKFEKLAKTIAEIFDGSYEVKIDEMGTLIIFKIPERNFPHFKGKKMRNYQAIKTLFKTVGFFDHARISVQFSKLEGGEENGRRVRD